MAHNRIHWHAGWHMPGCLPEAPYERFDTEDDARRYIVAEIETLWDQAYSGLPDQDPLTHWSKPGAEAVDARFLDAHTDLHCGAFTVGPIDGYLYSITECTDDCEGDELS